jgi:hypothetical protein
VDQRELTMRRMREVSDLVSWLAVSADAVGVGGAFGLSVAV